MLRPTLIARVKQWDLGLGLRVGRVGPVRLVSVAQRAAQLEIRLVVRASSRDGDNVLDFEFGHDEALRAEAVAATVTGSLSDAADEIHRQIVT
jgi:hypothetical protein